MREKVVSIKPTDRLTVLEERRRLKMARSAHAYVRGNTIQFYEWLKESSAKKVPQGPSIWICGDCHAGNLGPVANADGEVEIEIRDLDQTVVGNPAHDLIRLALSLATAVRGSDLPGVTTALMMEEMMAGYVDAVKPGRTKKAKGGAELRPIKIVLAQALKREWRHLAEERIEDVKPQIPLGDRFWTLSKEEREEIEKLFATEEARKLITCLKHRDDDAQIRVVDAAYWMKGCSSLGRLRYAVLLGVGKKKERQYCLVDIKEAVKAAAPAAKSAAMPKDFAKRVVAGACTLSPFLGERMLAARLLSRPVVMRELMPQDLKLEMDQLTREEAVASARYLAGVVGKAHARQMDVATRRNWVTELGKNRLKSLNAPGWLWSSVVELMANHETAYLEHCRRYAMA
ncbi:MAG TPA: DUF2252 family protein [Edaphobacter sp.]|nr:DUF2252 family protein [Edaphobacter sp.]